MLGLAFKVLYVIYSGIFSICRKHADLASVDYKSSSNTILSSTNHPYSMITPLTLEKRINNIINGIRGSLVSRLQEPHQAMNHTYHHRLSFAYLSMCCTYWAYTYLPVQLYYLGFRAIFFGGAAGLVLKFMRERYHKQSIFRSHYHSHTSATIR